MILKIFLFFLFSFAEKRDKEIWYDKFLEAMYPPLGVSFNASISQKQYDISSSISAYVEVLDSVHLLIEIDHETIILSGDTIQTFNKKTNQLIIDKLIDNDIGIFSLLSGNLRKVEIINTVSRKNSVQINFAFLSMGYSGYIEIFKSGKPKRIQLSFSSDQYIDITIDNFKTGGLQKYSGFNPSPKETINLYE